MKKKWNLPFSFVHLRGNKTLMMMKLAIFMLLLGTLQLSATVVFGQDKTLTIKVSNTSIADVLNEIESQSTYKFAYSSQFIDMARKVTLQLEAVELPQALQALFTNTNVDFRIENQFVVLVPKVDGDKMLGLSNQQQGKTVTGRVVNQSGETMPGVSIVIQGTTKGTITDVNGDFSLSGVPEDATLIFSFVGMTSREVLVAGQNRFSIVLEDETLGLDEVVVVGYGTQKKINLTGAISSVQGDILEDRPVAAVATGLQGLLPGVTITSASGQPGSPRTSILVRGVNTINSQTNPLILIDGVAGGDINLVNPDDIESVTVLKDAASSAIYGARAANGVILITTKRGKSKGKSVFSYSGYFGVQTPTSLPELVNGRQYMTLENEARRARGVAIPYSDEAFMKYDSKNFPNDYSNTDWIAETYKDYSTQQSHNVNINGKSDKSSYYMSYGFLEQTGLIVGDPYSSVRHNVRLRLDTEIADRLKLDGNLSFIDFYRSDAGGSGTGGVFRLSQRMSPLLPLKWQLPNDEGGFLDSPYWSYGSVANPVRTAYESGYTKNYSRTLNGNFNATLDLIDGMYANTQYSYNYYTRDIKDWTPTMPRFLGDGTPHASNDNAKNSISESHRSILTQTLTTTLNYKMQLAKHGVTILGGFSQEWAYLPVLLCLSPRAVLPLGQAGQRCLLLWQPC